MRNIQALTPFFRDVHGPRLHKGTSKYEDLFQNLTENECLCMYNINMCWIKYRPNGSHFEKITIKIYLNWSYSHIGNGGEI